MSGLIAIFNPNGIEGSLPHLIGRFPSHAAHRDSWSDSRFAAVRLHHGVLSPAAQPARGRTGDLVVFADGEVFGGQDDMRSAAERCRDILDGEGDGLADINGSFAALAYDAQRCRLTLISDRLNTRPLYYFQSGSETVVASHVAALTAHPKRPRTLNRQTLHELVAYRQAVSGNTIYEGIEWLPAASVASFEGRAPTVRTYWQLRWRDPTFARAELPEVIADGFRKTVTRRLARKTRHGLFLSGGLDSRMILAAAAKPPVCMTLGDVETDQVRVARDAAALSGTTHEFLTVDPESFEDHFEEGVRLTGGMYGYQQNHFLPVLDRARSHAEVALSGSYLDSVLRGGFLPSRKVTFGGASHRIPGLMPLAGGDLLHQLVHTQKTAFPESLVREVLTQEAAAEHEAHLMDGLRPLLADFASPHPHLAWNHVMLRAVSHTFGYPNIISIRSRMEASILAFDNDIIDIALQMPPQWASPDDAYREALTILSPSLARLQYANEGLPVNANPYLRTAYGLLQASVRTAGRRMLDRRPTSGPSSWLDFESLLRRPGPFRDRVQRLPDSEALAECGIFDRTGLRMVVDQHLSRRRNVAKFLIMLMTIENWIAQFGGKQGHGSATTRGRVAA